MLSKYWNLLFFVLFLCIFEIYAAKFKKVQRPRLCDKYHTWFSHGKSYKYSYTASSDASFVGTTDSTAGFKYTCDFSLRVPKKCEAILEIEACQLFEKQSGSQVIYKESPNSKEFNLKMSKNTLYFQFDKGEIISDRVVASNNDTVTVLNIKRAILSAIQLKIMPVQSYSKGSHQQTDIFGTCPTLYRISTEDPDVFYTERDLRYCQMPQIYVKPNNLFSSIQKLYGGYKVDDVSEAYYPFESSVKCQHRVNKRHQMKNIHCQQQQIFIPTAYNGSIFASCMLNVSQSLELKKIQRLKSRAIPRKLGNRKFVDLLYEFEIRKPKSTEKTVLNSIIQGMVQRYNQHKIHAIPAQYHQLILAMRNADKTTLEATMTDIWNCHGNNTNLCDVIQQVMEKDYFTDGLLSCGTTTCLTVFSQCLKMNHISNPLLATLFTYDIAINHPPSPDVLGVLYEMCKITNKMSCWLPVGIMTRHILEDPDIKTIEQDDVGYKIVAHIGHEIGFNCKQDFWDSLEKDEKVSKEERLILMLKVVGNVGSGIQRKFQTSVPVFKTLLDSLLICVDNSKLPYHLSKTAVQTLHNLKLTWPIKKSLLKVMRDINREPSVRTSAFLTLAKLEDPNMISELLKLVYTDPMDYMRLYVTSYVEAVLENDQPDKERYRKLWKNAIADDGRKLPSHNNFLVGKSRFIEMSRYLKFPWMTMFHGLQLEMDLVYDPSSPTYRSVVIRLNYYKGKKINILEISSDVHGIEDLLNKSVGHGHGLHKIFHAFLKIREIAARAKPINMNDMFGNIHPDIVKELRDLFLQVNYPKEDHFGGLLYWKIFGHEVAYADVHTLLMMIDPENLKMTFLNVLEMVTFHVNKGFYQIKTKASKQMDLTKVFPTISGASLNLTVLVTTVTSAEIKSKLNIKKFLLGVGPVEASSTIKPRGAVEFLGQMTIKLPDILSSGCRMVAQGALESNFELDMNVEKGKPVGDIIRSYKVIMSQKDIGKEFVFASVKSKLQLLHSTADTIEDIPFMPQYHDKYLKCYNWSLLTDQQLCIQVEYPNVTTSTRHAYFPLSGPFHGSIVRKKESMFKIMEYVAEFQQKKKSSNVLYFGMLAKGAQKTNCVNMSLSHVFPLHDISVELNVPTKDLQFTLQKSENKDDLGDRRTSNSSLDIYLKKHGKTVFGWKSQWDYEWTRRSIQRQHNLTWNLIMPDLKIDIELDTIGRCCGRLYRYFRFKRDFYCTKTWPSLYLLHIDQEYAEENGNKTLVLLEAEYGRRYHFGNWARNHTYRFLYPGQDITIKYNRTHTWRKNQTGATFDISYLGYQKQKEQLTVHALLDWFKKPGQPYYKSFYYNVNVTQKDKFNMHVNGEGEKSTHFPFWLFWCDATYIPVKVTEQYVEPDIKGNSKRCSHLMLNKDKIKAKVQFTTQHSEKQLPEGPMAGERVYKLFVIYPQCEKYAYLIMKGALGRKDWKDSIRHSRKWFDSKFIYGIHDSFDEGKEKFEIYKLAGISQDYHSWDSGILDNFDFNVKTRLEDSNTPNWNFSSTYSIGHRTAQKNPRNTILQWHVNQDLPWNFLNFITDNIIYYNFSCVRRYDSFKGRYMYSNNFFEFRENFTFTNSRWPWYSGDESHVLIDGEIKSKIQSIPGTFTFNFNGTRLKDHFPFGRMNFGATDVDFFFDVTWVNKYMLNITLMAGKTTNASRVLTWLIEPHGSTQLKHTVEWQTDQQLHENHTKRAMASMQDIRSKISQAILGKEPSPPLMKLFQSTFQSFLTPFLTTAKLSCLWQTHIKHNSESRPENSGKTEGQKKEKNTVWITPFLFKLDGLTKWQLTIGQKYLQSLKKLVVKKKGLVRSGTAEAYISQHRFIKTFDGAVYQIPENQVECRYLLTADFQAGRFALVSSAEEITLLTVDSTVSIDRKGRVFLGDCVTAQNSSFSEKTGSLTIEKSKKGVVKISTKYGLSLNCDGRVDACSVKLSSEFQNQTIGLLGNPDSERGTDLRTPDGKILRDFYKILPNFAIGGPSTCHETAVDLKYLNTSYKKSPKHCQWGNCNTIYKEPNDSTQTDIVFVIANNIPVKQMNSVLMEFIEILKSYLKDTRVGILAYGTGKKQISAIHQYFMKLNDINKTSIHNIWLTEEEDELSKVLTSAASYPFMTNSHKIIFLLSAKRDKLSSPNVDKLTTLFLAKKITLYIASVYSVIKKNTLGINWDDRAILKNPDRYKGMSFPKTAVMKILEETKGALIDLDIIIRKDKSRSIRLAEHLKEEISFHSDC